MQPSAWVVILGIGNVLLADEGVGPQAIARLRCEMLGESAELVDGGTLGLALLDVVESAERLIVIDAARLGRAAGSVRCFEGAAIDELLRARFHTVHELGLKDLIDMARLNGRLPQRRCLIAVEPAQVDWATELSPQVKNALDEVCTRVRETMARWMAEVTVDAA